MRVIGLDVHRSFAQVAVLENGVLRQGGRVDLVRDKLVAFARTLRPDDEVVLEATGNTMAIVRLLTRPAICRKCGCPTRRLNGCAIWSPGGRRSCRA